MRVPWLTLRQPVDNTQHATRNTHHPSGLIARYARFADYHEVIGGKLKALAEYIDASWRRRDAFALVCGYRAVAGTRPGATRRAGFYWQAHQPDQPQTRQLDFSLRNHHHAGDWSRMRRRKIAVAPARAASPPARRLPSPRLSNSTRAVAFPISPLNLKGPIPLELRPAIGNRIYGCDDCLAVCPWNRFAQEGKMMRPHARPDLATPELAGIACP